jgi:hypothetical protein
MRFEIFAVVNIKNTPFQNVVLTWYCGNGGSNGSMEPEMVTNKLTP